MIISFFCEILIVQQSWVSALVKVHLLITYLSQQIPYSYKEFVVISKWLQ